MSTLGKNSIKLYSSSSFFPPFLSFSSLGADYTTTLELYLDGPKRALQGATSHHLGQRFSKLFDIKFLSKKHNLSEFAWQNSWGFTTRSV